MARLLSSVATNAVLALVIAIPVLLLVVVSVGAGTQEVGLHPWWDTAGLVLLLVVPYAIAAVGLLQRPRSTARGIVLTIAGLASLVPSFLTLTLLIGLGLGVLALVLVAMGVFTLVAARAMPDAIAIVAALAAVALLLAAPFARFAGDDERCVRVTRDASGIETYETFTPTRTASGHLQLSPPPGAIREECTSDYTTATEAALSGAMTIGGAALAWFGTRGRRAAPAIGAPEGRTS